MFRGGGGNQATLNAIENGHFDIGKLNSDGSGGRRLPGNSRFINPAATTIGVALGMERDTWGAELFIDNLNNESAPAMQIAGHYAPAITVQRPRTIGLRLSYDFE